MPIPFLIGIGAAVAMGGFGIKKAVDASDRNDKARTIAERAQT